MTDGHARPSRAADVTSHRVTHCDGTKPGCCGANATRNRVAEMRDRIQYLIDDGWPAEDIAVQIAEEFAT